MYVFMYDPLLSWPQASYQINPALRMQRGNAAEAPISTRALRPDPTTSKFCWETTSGYRVRSRHPCRGHTYQSSGVLPTDGNWRSQCNQENLQRMQRCIGVVLWFQDNNVKLTKAVGRLPSWRRVMYMHAVVLSNMNKSYKLQLRVTQHVHVSNVDYTVNR